MYRSELKYSDRQLIDSIWQGYAIEIQVLHYIDSGSFFGFIVEKKDNSKLFLKVYPNERIMDNPYLSKASLNEVGFALQRFHTEFGIKNLPLCIPTLNKQFYFEANGLLFILFEHIEGIHPSYLPNQLSANKLAYLFYQLHHISGEEFPNLKTEDFNIDYALGFENWIAQNEFPKKSAFFKSILTLLTLKKEILFTKLNELKEWQKKYSKQTFNQVITHGDPHHYNVLQTSEDLWLVDWDDMKIAPPERDLWHYEKAPLIQEYIRFDPTFKLNNELCNFYQRQRFFEDIRYYLERIFLSKNATNEQDEKDAKSLLEHWGWELCLDE